jgi:hypothetical protein
MLQGVLIVMTEGAEKFLSGACYGFLIGALFILILWGLRG